MLSYCHQQVTSWEETTSRSRIWLSLDGIRSCSLVRQMSCFSFLSHMSAMEVIRILLILAAFLVAFCSSSDIQKSKKGMLVVYWGTYKNEGSLKSACDTGNYDIVVLSFLDKFGNGRTPHLELANHCSKGNCQSVGEDVKACQSRGVKIFLSIGGADGQYGIVSKADAVSVANYLWNNYLGGTESNKSRPLGDAVLDGIDFDIEIGGLEHYADLAMQLKQLMTTKGNKTFYLSAAPQCPFPDPFHGPGAGSALQTGLFDYVWVQFYNNEDCHYHPKGSLDNLFAAWDKWASIPAQKVFFGLPASLSGATDHPSPKDGYMPPDVLISEVLPRIKKSSKYGGVMLWSYYYDFSHRDGAKVPYSTAIKNQV